MGAKFCQDCGGPLQVENGECAKCSSDSNKQKKVVTPPQDTLGKMPSHFILFEDEKEVGVFTVAQVENRLKNGESFADTICRPKILFGASVPLSQYFPNAPRRPINYTRPITNNINSTPTWQAGSVRNGVAAIGSFLLPGIGQIAQKRFLLGLVMFAFMVISWPIFLGWIFHIWACFNALKYNDGDKLSRKAMLGFFSCSIIIISTYVIAQNPSAFFKLVASNVMPQPVLLEWKPVKNLLEDDEVEATVRNKGANGTIQFVFTAGNDFEKTYQTYFDHNETRTVKFSIQGAPSGDCKLYLVPIRK